MSWVQHNWEKVLSAVLAVIVGGVVGFSSAILAVNEEVYELKAQVVILKERLAKIVEPRIKHIDGVSTKVINLDKRIVAIETRTLFLTTQSHIILKSQAERAHGRE